MALYRTATPGKGGGILPDQFAELVVRPVQTGSVAYLVSTLLTTPNARVHLPIVATDTTAAWTAEGAEITPSDPGLGEIIVEPSKVAGLTIVSREMALDSNPAAAELVGQSLARDIARKIDSAFFGSTTVNGPSGLASVTGVGEVDGGTPTSADPFAQAVSQAEQAGAAIGAWTANPADALALAQIKEATGSARGLLQPDPTQPGRRLIEGVPLLVSPAVPEGTVWGVPREFTFVVEREGTTVDVDGSAYFSSDRIGVRAVHRVGFGFPHPAALQKITVDFTP